MKQKSTKVPGKLSAALQKILHQDRKISQFL